MIYDPVNEKMERSDLEQLQLERLQSVLQRVRRNVGFYKEKLNTVDIESIHSIKDLQKLPFTTKKDLVQNYPYGMFAVPLHDTVRLHSTSGTTGKPLVVGYTHNDIQIWRQLIARIYSAAGVTNHDFVQISFHYGQSTAAMGFHYGAEKIGASVIPSSGESITRQLMVMKDYRTSCLIGTPSYALQIASALSTQQLTLPELALRVGIFGAESWSEKTREEIESKLGIKAFDNYGITELVGPGVSFECEMRNGLHINEDHFLVEVIDPKTLENVPAGEKGELVFTSLTREAYPLIRYRTGDIASLLTEPCSCGRTTVRMSRLEGRTDDMIIVDGVNIFPSQIEQCIIGVSGIQPYFKIELNSQDDGTETVCVQIEASADFPYLDELSKVEALRKQLETKIQESLGIKITVQFVEPKTMSVPDGKKYKRIIDNRKK